MKIYYTDGREFLDVIVTQDAVHEEELMKSDFVRLSWDDVSGETLPVGAYIIPFLDGVRYSLHEPYTPQQKNEATYHYEPQFQHEKMYLDKVPFKRSSSDVDGNPVMLIDWTYVGMTDTLLADIVTAANEALGLSGTESLHYEFAGNDVNGVVSLSFQTVSILGALSELSSAKECEYHIDWAVKTLYFGHIAYKRDNSASTPVLQVGVNVGIPSVRSTKDGFSNAFEAQGSNRNIFRRSQSGESVQSMVRLSLMPKVDSTTGELDTAQVFDLNHDDYPDGIHLPDGIVYTDDYGRIVSKDDFDELGRKKFAKSLIFDDIYPKSDYYVYDCRCREFYRLADKDDTTSKIQIGTDSNGEPIYEKYAVWYVKLAYLKSTQWVQFKMEDNVFITFTSRNDLLEYKEHPVYDALDGTTTLYPQYILNIPWDSSWMQYSTDTSCEVTIKVGADVYVAWLYKDSYQGQNKFALQMTTPTEHIDSDVALWNTVIGDILANGGFAITNSLLRVSNMPKKYRRSIVIEGKKAIFAFQPNTYYRQRADEAPVMAESTPLAGRGSGDGNGHYGFEVVLMADQSMVNKAKERADNEVAYDANFRIEVGDFEIRFEESGDYILPSTESLGIIPKGAKDANGNEITNINDLRNLGEDVRCGNVVSVYNIQSTSEQEVVAQERLSDEVKKYIKNLFTDNSTYTIKAYGTVFKDSNPNLHIGEKVIYRNGSYELETRVMKLVTKLDFVFDQEISIGNEIIKGSNTILKEQVKTILSGI